MEPFERINYLLSCINGTDELENSFRPLSRVENILYAYIKGLSYTDEPESRLEKLFAVWCKFKPKTILDFMPSSRTEQILWTKINGGVYTGKPMSRCEELLLGGSSEEYGRNDPIVAYGQVDYAILTA
jgi:hypothetical protein